MNKLAVFGLLAVFLTSTSAIGQTEGKRKGRGANVDGAAQLERMMQAFDKDKDGTISKTEAPPRMKERFGQIDGNSDGILDATEIKRAFARRMQRGGQPGPGNSSANKGKGAKGKKGDAAGPGAPRPGGGRGLNLAALFKEGDTDGDGNLNPAEQKAIIAKVNQMMQRIRQMRGDGKQKKGSDRFARPNTDPVKPKRPGMKD